MRRTLEGRQLAALEAVFGPAHVLLADGERRHYGTDWSGGPDPEPVAVVRPDCGEQLQALLRLAAEWHWPLVPSGGRTGLAGGARAANGEIVVSFERMRRILDFDAGQRLLICEPGVVTATVQQFAAERGLYYPVEFAADGSSQIGGNIATNAGGVRVLRYGMTRRQVAGLAWLDAAGQTVDEMRCLRKDNTGPALRELLIGSEGSLGLITGAGLWLQAAPPPRATALIRLADSADLPALMQALGVFELHACELMDARAWQLGQAEAALSEPPAAAVQLLVEAPADAMTAEALAKALAGQPAAEVLLAQSQAQAGHFWAVREAITPALRPQAPLKFDLGFRLAVLPAVLAAINTQWPQAVVFGHLGDGNLHVNIPSAPDAAATEAAVYRLVAEHRGTLTAEHGIGRLRRAALHAQEAAGRLAWLRQVKRALDPQGLLNPGVLV